jgi:hypothetical protein
MQAAVSYEIRRSRLEDAPSLSAVVRASAAADAFIGLAAEVGVPLDRGTRHVEHLTPELLRLDHLCGGTK